jgi:hypothetical protein
LLSPNCRSYSPYLVHSVCSPDPSFYSWGPHWLHDSQAAMRFIINMLENIMKFSSSRQQCTFCYLPKRNPIAHRHYGGVKVSLTSSHHAADPSLSLESPFPETLVCCSLTRCDA